MGIRLVTGVAAAMLSWVTPWGQAPAAIVQPGDAGVTAASELVGRATILRGFYGGGTLNFDGNGRVEGQQKVVDWTLAGFALDKVERKGPGEIELDGVRVAIRYNADQHIFERHPLKDERVKIGLAAGEDEKAVRRALTAIFSVGLDPALQRAMPPYWQHYFIPGLAWPPDELGTAAIVPPNAKPEPGLVFPAAEKKTEPEYTSEASKDRVQGTVQVKLVVGADGVPRRIGIRQPLGYGLDQRTVDAVSKWRFRPGTKDGVPAAFEFVVSQTFEVAVPVR